MASEARPAAMSVTGTAAAIALLYVFRAILWPFVLAFVLAIMIDALVRTIRRLRPGARELTVRLLAGGVVGVLVVISTLVLIRGVSELAVDTPRLVSRLDVELVHASRMVGAPAPLTLERLVARIDMPTLAGHVLARAQDAVAGMVLTEIFLIFILVSKARIVAKVRLAAALGPAEKILSVVRRSLKGVEAYVWIQTVTGLMIAVGSGAVMFAVGLHDVLFWTLVLFMLSYIPVLGTTVGSIAPALFALVQFPTVWPAIAIFTGVQAVSFVVGNFVLPKMQADTQNIDPSMSLIATGIWTILWGIPGAFLAIPLTLALMYQLAQVERLRWLAILISNDGRPFPETEEIPPGRPT
jgi:predicted PurR-regulated permease PerM